MLEKILVFVFGACIGSFLNVCIHRMPLGESLIRPRSHCPKCKKQIAWHDNIPLISFIILKARCRHCKARIHLRYFTVELITAAAFVIFYSYFDKSTFDFVFYTIFFCGLLVATFIDIGHRIIPDEISIGGMILGFVLSSLRGINFSPLSFSFKPMLNSFLGIIVGGGIIYSTSVLFDLVYFRLLKRPPIQGETESMGGGDVKLLAMIGAFLGWQKALLTFFIAPFFGIAVGLFSLIIKKDHTIPYGPFLSLAALLSLFWAHKIIYFFIFR